MFNKHRRREGMVSLESHKLLQIRFDSEALLQHFLKTTRVFDLFQLRMKELRIVFNFSIL